MTETEHTKERESEHPNGIEGERPPVRRAETEDGPVAYATYGSPDGPPVVLFHGTPGSRLLGELFARPARERGLRLLVPDRPGYGHSPAWPDRTLSDGAAIARAVLDEVGASRAGVVGFSGGGAQALAAAADCGDRITAVDLVSTATPPSLRETTPGVQRLLDGLARHAPTALRALLRGGAWAAERRPSLVLSTLTADPGAIPDREAAAVARDFVEGIGPARSGFVTETRLLGSEWGVSLDAPSVPIRLSHGVADDNVPIAGARRLADRLPDATLSPFETGDHLTTLLDGRESVLDRQADRFGR